MSVGSGCYIIESGFSAEGCSFIYTRNTLLGSNFVQPTIAAAKPKKKLNPNLVIRSNEFQCERMYNTVPDNSLEARE